MFLEPRKVLNKAFLKIKPNRLGIELFKQNLIQLLDSVKEKESEEFHKNLISDFLKNTYYSPNHFINTKGRNDLVIHIGKDTKSNVGVIIEAKSPSNKAEMLSQNNINSKALQELVLYFLRERITHKNLEIKNVVATNVDEWYIFDAQVFDKLFAQNKNFVKQFHAFEEGKLSGKNTDFFYKEIAKPYIETIIDKLEYTYFNLATYDKILRNSDKEDDSKLIVLYKLLSPEHLLKLSFANDSNTLDKNFYNELLHLIGLTETKEGGKKLIQRPKAEQRNAGSLLENVINQLDILDKIPRLTNVKQYGDTHEECLFNVGLELCITWVNRILFLKLLEAQLITYHKGDKSYAFLHKNMLNDYDNLNALFFMILAKKPEERNERIKHLFAKVPYLNSSLFEPTELEHQTLFISGLEDDIQLPVLNATVLKDTNGKKLTGIHKAIDYFFEFLDAYDFASEGSEEIQEDNKTLINASVLGLIFEKINGYKDGSFYTPSFITMYMCKETIRRAVLQKFNETKGWNCEDFEGLYNKIEDTKEANAIINSVKICDPAVGSGHFLVSALNEMIAIKHDLKILSDREGKRLKEYQVDIVNDELIITDEDGMPFVYNPKNPESQRIQETLFHEKQTIIENCLFGVDINPNSVKICRLRLWIELLKNAYYKSSPKPSKGGELETLPNIDINIKCGNSLISRFGLDADLKKALKQSKWNIESYKLAVTTYRNAESKVQKREMQQLIDDIKGNFSTEIAQNDPAKTKLDKLISELYHRFTGNFLFEPEESYGNDDKKLKQQSKKEQETLEKEIEKQRTIIEDKKNNRIYDNAFEWRFEFPEVLNDEGDFVGFDVVIGNPPYGVKFNESEKDFYKLTYQDIHIRTPESYNYFIKKFSTISNKNALCSFIIPSSFLNQVEFEKTREILLNNYSLFLILNLGDGVFEDVTTTTCIIGFDKKNKATRTVYEDLSKIDRKQLSSELKITKRFVDIQQLLKNQSFSFIYRPYTSILEKCYVEIPTLKDIAEEVATGISSGLDKAFVYTDEDIKNKKLETDLLEKLVIGGEINRFSIKPISTKKIIYITNANDIEDYPNINHEIIKYKDKLIKRREALNGSIKWYSLNWPRRKKLFEEPKILIRQTANRIIAAYDDDKWYCLKSGIIIQLPAKSKISYKYLLAIFNSSLMNFLYNDLVNENNRIFPEVKPIQLFKLPIKIADDNFQKIVSKKIDQILSLKKDNPSADTSALEREIDLMVYALYGLTEEEIEIVEKS